MFHITHVNPSELAKVLNGTPGGFTATAAFIIAIRLELKTEQLKTHLNSLHCVYVRPKWGLREPFILCWFDPIKFHLKQVFGRFPAGLLFRSL